MNVELETGAASRFPPSPSVSSELGAIVSYRVVYKCIFDIVFFYPSADINIWCTYGHVTPKRLKIFKISFHH